MNDHEVVIAGGGPTGLMLAAELALAGVDAVVVERRVDQVVDGSRAGGLLARTIEVLDQRGVAERFLEAGQVLPMQGYGGIILDVSDFPSPHPYVLALWQSAFEPILADWVAELGVPIVRGREVTGVVPQADGVSAELSDGTSIRAEYLVGCDGGRSLVRKSLGIEFVGVDPSTSWMIAEVEMDEEPEFGFRRDAVGAHAMNRRQPGEPIRVVLTEREVDHAGDPTLDDLREAIVGVYGTDFGLRSAGWISRFTDMTRQAATYRVGRVLLAGDAAHLHPPHGGQGLNTGVQDAVNLGWKLGLVVAGHAPDSLLDTYHAERHPVGAQVLRNTMAQVALSSPGERHEALRDTMGELLSMDEPRRRIAARLAALDIRYDGHGGHGGQGGQGDGHPLLGRRMPDLDVVTSSGPTRVFELLRDARGIVLDLGAPGSDTGGIDVSGWADRVRMVRVDPVDRSRTTCELPVIGDVPMPTAVLIRPDGHVAWTGDAFDAGLHDALTSWFGPPTAPS